MPRLHKSIKELYIYKKYNAFEYMFDFILTRMYVLV